MTHAGETVGRAVGTGLRTLRRGAVQVAAAAEHKLAEGAETVRDATAAQQAEVARTGRKARRQLVREAKQTGRELVKSAKQARKTARTAIAVPGDVFAAATTPAKRRRTWPWLLAIGVAVAGAGTAYVLKNQQKDKPRTDAEDDSRNGSAPEPRHEQPVDNQQPVHRA
ncbi:MAG TPA: hypothetical protein VHF06_27105 [Pseudonocardiaceae bacterium]|nr:hypothetical protein [Pseudonocardiaceae bacterium]